MYCIVKLTLGYQTDRIWEREQDAGGFCRLVDSYCGGEAPWWLWKWDTNTWYSQISCAGRPLAGTVNGVRRPRQMRGPKIRANVPPEGPCWHHRGLSPWCDCRRLGSTLGSWRWQDINVGNPLWRRTLLVLALWCYTRWKVPLGIMLQLKFQLSTLIGQLWRCSFAPSSALRIVAKLVSHYLCNNGHNSCTWYTTVMEWSYSSQSYAIPSQCASALPILYCPSQTRLEIPQVGICFVHHKQQKYIKVLPLQCVLLQVGIVLFILSYCPSCSL